MRESGDVQVNITDIGDLDHFLVRLELGRVTKCCKKQKQTIRKWRVDRFSDEGVRAKYSEALKVEVESFSDSIGEKVREGISGSGLVSAVVEEWEQVVKKVAKAEVGEKVVVCGRAVRWWDDEIKQKIEHGREAYKKVLRVRIIYGRNIVNCVGK